jgi:hypothetical protein
VSYSYINRRLVMQKNEKIPTRNWIWAHVLLIMGLVPLILYILGMGGCGGESHDETSANEWYAERICIRLDQCGLYGFAGEAEIERLCDPELPEMSSCLMSCYVDAACDAVWDAHWFMAGVNPAQNAVIKCHAGCQEWM